MQRIEIGRRGSSEEEFSMLNENNKHASFRNGGSLRSWLACLERYGLIIIALVMGLAALVFLAAMSASMERLYEAVTEEDADEGFEGLRPKLKEHKTDFATFFTRHDDAGLLYMELPSSTVSAEAPVPLLFNAIFAEATATDDGAFTLLNYPADITDETLFTLQLTEDGSGIDVVQAMLTMRTTDSSSAETFACSGATRRLMTLSIVSEREIPDDDDAGAAEENQGGAAEEKANMKYVVDASPLVEHGFFVTAVTKSIVEEWRLNLNATKAFLRNADIAVEYIVSTDGLDIDATSLDTDTLPAKVPLALRFSISTAPGHPMHPRLADERVGFFSTSYTDLGNHEAAYAEAGVFKRQADMVDTTVSVINKRRIGGSHGPLTYYVDPSVPEKWRLAVRRGVEQWRPAFKAIGFEEEVIRCVLPGDKDWPADYDAGDIRYNSISWAIDTLETFALGPATIDPRTGEILRSDIVFTHGWIKSWLGALEHLDLAVPAETVRNRRNRRQLAVSGGGGGGGGGGASLPAEGFSGQGHHHHHSHGEAHEHSHGHENGHGHFAPRSLQARILLGDGGTGSVGGVGGVGGSGGRRSRSVRSRQSLRHHSLHACQGRRLEDASLPMLRLLADAKHDGKVPDSVLEQGLSEVVMHEVGHTLGLRHNFRGSSAHTLEELQDKNFTQKHGISSSVMDYMPVNLASKALRPAGGVDAVDLFSPVIGEYDYWVIEYGYKEVEGETLLSQHPTIAATADKALSFATDEDGSDTTGMDPMASVFDLSSDPLFFFADRLALVAELRPSLLDRSVLAGEPYANLAAAEASMLTQVLWSARYAAKYVGGYMSDRQRRLAAADGAAAKPVAPLAAVSGEKQRVALDLMLRVLTEAPGGGIFASGDSQAYLVKMSGVCSGLEQYCYAMAPYDLPAKTMTVRKGILSSLFDGDRLSRVRLQEWALAPAFDGGGGGNTTAAAAAAGTLGLHDLFSNVTSAIFGPKLFAGDRVKKQQQWELQLHYADILLNLASTNADDLPAEVAAVATGQLYEILKSIEEMRDSAALPLATTFQRRLRLFEQGAGAYGSSKSSG